MEERQAFNPYLPSWEYLPDGEPRLFGDRVYVYGSHDRFNGRIFCMNDYVCWSAPANDLSDWRCEGVIYRRNQDPKNPLGLRLLFAPDVVQGTDGRYYLYYAFDFYGMISTGFMGGSAIRTVPSGAENREISFPLTRAFWWIPTGGCISIPGFTHRFRPPPADFTNCATTAMWWWNWNPT